MPHRSYDHYCGIARALDVLGERWALLIVRELLAGPRRYSDLLADLPGISTDVLATRLRELERDNLVRRATTGARSYELTAAGAAAAPILDALTHWGLPRLGPRTPADALRGHWLGTPLVSRLAAGSPKAAGTLRVHLAETVFHLHLTGTEVRLVEDELDSDAQPDAVLRLEAAVAGSIAAGQTTVDAAVRDGQAYLYGAPEIVAALRAC